RRATLDELRRLFQSAEQVIEAIKQAAIESGERTILRTAIDAQLSPPLTPQERLAKIERIAGEIGSRIESRHKDLNSASETASEAILNEAVRQMRENQTRHREAAVEAITQLNN